MWLTMRTFPFSFFFGELFPVLFFLAFLLFRDEVVFLFSTHLGKVCAIYLIVVYLFLDAFYGLVVCFLFILYYQVFEGRVVAVERGAGVGVGGGGGEEKKSGGGGGGQPLVTKDVIGLIGIGVAAPTN